MLVRAKCWLKANGVWHKPGAEIEIDPDCYKGISENVDVLRADEPVAVPADNGEAIVNEKAEKPEVAAVPAKKPGRPKKSK